MQSFGRDSQNDAPTAFVGNLTKETVQGDLDELFKGLKLEQVRIIHDKETGEPKGYGYVTFRDQESLDEALKLNGTDVNGQPIRVDVKKPRQDRGPRGGGGFQRGGYQGGGGGGFAPRGGNDFGGGAFGSRQQRYNDFGGDRQGGGGYQQGSSGGYQQGSGGGYQQDRSVRPVPDVPPFVAYVGNLPEQCMESDISTMFEGLNLVKVHLVQDRETGLHRGFGFAEFKDKASLQNALTLDAAEWMGKQLKVRVHERRERAPFGGEGGGESAGRSGGSFERGGRFEQPRSGGFDRFPRGGGAAGGGEFRERRPPREEPEPINDGKERPKLVLQKKTEGAAPAAAAEPAKPASGNKPNPFGNARPVDTATKLLQKEEEKRKAEKAAAEKAAAEAPAKAPEAAQAE